jgi:hypothetical protein
MATDVLVLGSIAFDSWSTPEKMPFGGKQELVVHQLPGGSRVVDTLGPVEKNIIFTGQMYENNAYGVADELDSMRIAGAQVPLTFAGRFYMVIIEEVIVDIRRFPQLVEYHCNCLVVQNNMAGSLGAITSTTSQFVVSDMATALNIVGL